MEQMHMFLEYKSTISHPYTVGGNCELQKETSYPTNPTGAKQQKRKVVRYCNPTQHTFKSALPIFQFTYSLRNMVQHESIDRGYHCCIKMGSNVMFLFPIRFVCPFLLLF
ncbi:hypothetical protein BsWGS_15311 [Bradybaena similaris]